MFLSDLVLGYGEKSLSHNKKAFHLHFLETKDIKYLTWYHSSSYRQKIEIRTHLQIQAKSPISSKDNGKAPATPTENGSACCFKASSNHLCNCFPPANSSLCTPKVLLFLFIAFHFFLLYLLFFILAMGILHKILIFYNKLSLSICSGKMQHNDNKMQHDSIVLSSYFFYSKVEKETVYSWWSIRRKILFIRLIRGSAFTKILKKHGTVRSLQVLLF